MKDHIRQGKALVERYLRQEMTADELRLFDAQLRRDPELRRELLCEISIDAELVRFYRALELTGSNATPPLTCTRRYFLSRRRMFVHLAWAASFLAVVGAALWLQRAELPPDVIVSETETRAEKGTRITVAKTEAERRFTYADGSHLLLHKNTEVDIKKVNGAKHIVVEYGAFDADVSRQPEGVPMVVRTREITASVLGTQFRVMSDKTSSWLGVREGTVEVKRNSDGKTILLKAGEYAAVRNNGESIRFVTQCPYWREQCLTMAGSVYR